MAEENKQPEKKEEISEDQSKAPVEPSTPKLKDNKTPDPEAKEYTIPLRKAWLKKASYRRAGQASKAIKQFVARHMKVPDRDTSKVKIDQYLNQELWFRGRAKPPAKIKVKVTKSEDLFKVELADIPEFHKFQKARLEKIHKEPDKKPAPVPTEEKPKPEEKQTEEEKKEEKEKAQSAADVKAKQAEVQAKAEKQASKAVKQPKIQRKALQK
ncbi:hypothetical protein CMI47_11670 [Candidatus Pacearchaeota archaeon]|nr:hypothetical protein [Candidatus Pacearchaeota archaeon]|tara:strand:- start:9745 stop:10380 length:636 start_codon:yes stop_codon:yes gene_type:complete